MLVLTEGDFISGVDEDSVTGGHPGAVDLSVLDLHLPVKGEPLPTALLGYKDLQKETKIGH